jgi:hypothetical protein
MRRHETSNGQVVFWRTELDRRHKDAKRNLQGNWNVIGSSLSSREDLTGFGLASKKRDRSSSN